MPLVETDDIKIKKKQEDKDINIVNVAEKPDNSGKSIIDVIEEVDKPKHRYSEYSIGNKATATVT